MTRFLCVMAAVLLWAMPASATSPCMMQTPEEFQVVKDQSDLIVHVKILDYKTSASQILRSPSWTKAQVLHVYKGDFDKKEIHITGWASYEQPLYTQDVGSEAVLLLKQTDAGFEMTDLSWKACVPSLIGLPATFPMEWKGKTYAREEFIEARLNPEQQL
jgi:hypothetical protein